MERLFVDTSAWVAFANTRDPDHRAVVRALRKFEGRLVTSNFVFDEVVTLSLARFGHAIAAKIGNVLLDADVADLVRVTADDERTAWRLFLDRADKTYSFTDCTSFTMMRRLGLTTAATLDDGFTQEGFEVVPTR